MPTTEEIIAEALAEIDVAERLLDNVGFYGRRPANLDAGVEAVKRARALLERTPSD